MSVLYFCSSFGEPLECKAISTNLSAHLPVTINGLKPFDTRFSDSASKVNAAYYKNARQSVTLAKGRTTLNLRTLRAVKLASAPLTTDEALTLCSHQMLS